MCGIFAIINNEPFNETSDYVYNQFMKGANRGPDNSSLTTTDNITIGFHRLAINGLNSASNQPIEIDKIMLICNGEIYNYKDVYAELGITPTTQSDCEVIIHLYKKFGIDYTLNILDGVFAFILFDLRTRAGKIYIARDPYGVRPLYMLKYDNSINNIPQDELNSEQSIYAFASEIKCLYGLYTQLGDKYKISHVKPSTYITLTNYYNNTQSLTTYTQHSTATIYHTMSVINTTPIANKHANYYTEYVSSIAPSISDMLYNTVIKQYLTTDRKVACLLSGGLDSSLITALICNYNKIHGLPSVETYSIGLKDSVDLHHARIVSDYLNTKHTEIILTEEDFVNAIPEIICNIESYDTTTVRASTGNYLIGKYIKAHSDAKVIFNGDGSDELTGGYLYFHKAPNAVEFDKECRRLLNDIHLFDVLRSDKCISSHGLESRTPFLDRTWVQFYLSIPIDIRCHAIHGMCEKHLLRTAFNQQNFKTHDNKQILPDVILWRRKEAFSDGVSGQSRSLYEIIQEHIKNNITSRMHNGIYNIRINTYAYHANAPTTQEQIYYRKLFELSYNGIGYIVPYMWMPKFIEAADASARTLSIYNE